MVRVHELHHLPHRILIFDQILVLNYIVYTNIENQCKLLKEGFIIIEFKHIALYLIGSKFLKVWMYLYAPKFFISHTRTHTHTHTHTYIYIYIYRRYILCIMHSVWNFQRNYLSIKTVFISKAEV